MSGPAAAVVLVSAWAGIVAPLAPPRETPPDEAAGVSCPVAMQRPPEVDPLMVRRSDEKLATTSGPWAILPECRPRAAVREWDSIVQDDPPARSSGDAISKIDLPPLQR